MNSIITVIKKEFSPIFPKLIIHLIFNLFCSVVLFILFIKGITVMIPEFDQVSTKIMFIPNIVAIMTVSIAFVFAYFNINKLFHTSILYQIKTTNLMESQLFWGKFLSFLLFTIIHMFFSLLIITILAGVFFNILFNLSFLLYLLYGIIFIIQISIILGILIPNQSTFSLILIFIFLPLILISGTIIPSNVYSSFLQYIVQYLPTTMIIEGAKKIYLGGNINLVYLIIISLFNILTSIISYKLFKKEFIS